MRKKIGKYIILVVFAIVGFALFVCSYAIENDRALVASTFFLTALTTFLGAYLDPRLNKFIRATFIAISFACLALGFFGIFMANITLEIALYCVFLGSLDLFKGIVKLVEAGMMQKERNKMCYLFFVDSLVEIVLGVLMIIELNATIRTHVVLIGIDIVYEGIIKFINEYVEAKLFKDEEEA